LPKAQVQPSQLPVQISYFLQNCKKGKSPSNGFALLKNDITGSEPTVKMLDTLQIFKGRIIKKAGPFLALPSKLIITIFLLLQISLYRLNQCCKGALFAVLDPRLGFNQPNRFHNRMQS
jgi:hypothetical protein